MPDLCNTLLELSVKPLLDKGFRLDNNVSRVIKNKRQKSRFPG
jgi:hypothetical protein